MYRWMERRIHQQVWIHFVSLCWQLNKDPFTSCSKTKTYPTPSIFFKHQEHNVLVWWAKLHKYNLPVKQVDMKPEMNTKQKWWESPWFPRLLHAFSSDKLRSVDQLIQQAEFFIIPFLWCQIYTASKWKAWKPYKTMASARHGVLYFVHALLWCCTLKI